MYLLDTNALIALYKKQKKLNKATKIYTSILNVIEFPIVTQIQNITILFPPPDSYLKAIDYSAMLRNIGTPIAAIDLMIGVLAVENELTLVTNDSDFDVLVEIEPKLVTMTIGNFVDQP